MAQRAEAAAAASYALADNMLRGLRDRLAAELMDTVRRTPFVEDPESEDDDTYPEVARRAARAEREERRNRRR